jgi:transcriptional regulator NrdR family protein
MICIYCGAPAQELRVLVTDHTDTQTRRRRICRLCDQRFSTVEVAVRDGQRTSHKELVMLPAGTKRTLTS